MIFEIKKVDGILKKFKINIAQLYILQCIHEREREALMYYVKSNISAVSEIKDLENKKILEYDRKHDKFEISDYIISEDFLKDFLIDIDKAGQELYDAYPSFIEVDSKQILSKKGDKDYLIAKYCKDINYDPETHNKVLKAIPIAKAQGSLNMAIRNFIEHKLYMDIIELIDNVKEEVSFRKSI